MRSSGLFFVGVLILSVSCAQKSVEPEPPKVHVPIPANPVPLSQDINEIKRSITNLEIETFGDTKAKQIGLANELKICQTHLASKAAGGTGELLWDEPTEKISEEWLKKGAIGLETYQAVFMVAQYRRDYFKRELASCEAIKATKPASDGGVQVTEGATDNDERVHKFVCGFVTQNASLREFLIQSFSRGTLKLEDFDLGQKFLVATLKDKNSKEKPNGLMFMGWKLSFDRGPLTFKEILLDRKDAFLQAWTFSGNTEDVVGAKQCLRKGNLVWNY